THSTQLTRSQIERLDGGTSLILQFRIDPVHNVFHRVFRRFDRPPFGGLLGCSTAQVPALPWFQRTDLDAVSVARQYHVPLGALSIVEGLTSEYAVGSFGYRHFDPACFDEALVLILCSQGAI